VPGLICWRITCEYWRECCDPVYKNMVQAKQLYAMWGNMQEYNWIVKMYGVMLDSCYVGDTTLQINKSYIKDWRDWRHKLHMTINLNNYKYNKPFFSTENCKYVFFLTTVFAFMNWLGFLKCIICRNLRNSFVYTFSV